MSYKKKPRRIPEFASGFERGEFYRNKALFYIEFKMRTASEVEQYLREWECPEEILAETMAFLIEYGYLDDMAFARAYIRQEREFRHRSRKDITYRLMGKGIDIDRIRQAFDEEEEDSAPEEPSAETAQAIRLIEKRLSVGKTDREKNIAFLQRKGFSYGTIREAMGETEN